MIVTEGANGYTLDDGGKPLVYKKDEIGLLMCDILHGLGIVAPAYYVDKINERITHIDFSVEVPFR